MRILETVLPLFVMIGLGMLCREKRIFTPEGIGALKSLAVNISLPAVLFSAFATAEYSAASALIPLVMFGVCALALALGSALCRLLHLRGRLTPYMASGFEAGMLGYALFALLFPNESSSSFAIVDLGQVLFVFTVYKALLVGRGGLKSAVNDALHSPVIWAILAGLAFGISGLYGRLSAMGLGGVIDRVANFIAAPTGAVILLTIGYDLVPRELRWRSTAALVGLRLAVMAFMFCAVLGINRLFLGGAIHTGALALMFILPPPFVLPVFADMGTERADVVSALSALTLLCLLLFAGLTLVFA